MPARRTRYHHGDLRNALLEAALALIAQKGAKALTLREVARRAGVSHAAPHHHFRDRAALLAAVAEAGFEGLTQAMRTGMERTRGDALDRLRATGEAYVRFGLEHPSHLRVMFTSEVGDVTAHPHLEQAEGESFNVLLQASADALGFLGGDLERAPHYALAGWSMMHGLITLWNDGPLQHLGPVDVPALAHQFGQLLIEGLRQEAGPRAGPRPARRRARSQ